MKAISLHQPWASAIASGVKTIETRHWPTKHRGKIAIHAAKRPISGNTFWHILQDRGEWCRVFDALGVKLLDRKALNASLPFGVIVAIATIDGCMQVKDTPVIRYDDERAFGDYSAGRYLWTLHNIERLVEPIPFTGRQGLFEVPDDLIFTGEDA